MADLRYFILSDKPKARFIELEMAELGAQTRAFETLSARGVGGFRAGRDGSVVSLKFDDGKKPDGVKFVRADKRLPSDEVRPHGRDKSAKEWRELLKGLKIPRSQPAFRLEFGLTAMVMGGAAPSGHGVLIRDSAVAHVGPEVVAVVPVNEHHTFEPTEGFAEIKKWEFEKLKDDHENTERQKGLVYW